MKEVFIVARDYDYNNYSESTIEVFEDREDAKLRAKEIQQEHPNDHVEIWPKTIIIKSRLNNGAKA